ncbi:pyroglutamyl-peptidase I [Photobacterium rosenbergii]|uniref:Pyroglutamyl-peptidase I n=1 Tax=Photobacterium rosenbergii TaxID=294936 RepID=A0ABU3ZEF5_9GAMM|nr:pyroglutamyl-peptidase I [Photobacterium rosenbergii]MDV5168496.1 pyroglutamyl-peptidase I [Photobacterium rosenbergii]
MTRVLVTGFEAFGGQAINPTALIIDQLQTDVFQQTMKQAGVVLKTALLPVVKGESVNHCIDAIESFQPDIVLMLGQASGRANISFEKVAINLDDFRIPDNAGNQPIDQPVVDAGPAAYFTQLPVKTLMQALKQQGVGAEISYSAGTFVCNHLFYGISHYLATQTRLSSMCDFIHVPLLPEQIEAELQITDNQSLPSMPLETMVEGIACAIVTATSFPSEQQISAGTIN